jgi:hypothetical protein
MSPKPVGLWIGLILGLGWVIGGFSGMLLVAFVGAVGFLVEKVREGEIDLSEYFGSRERR